jgi:hypothetical protein
MSNFHGLEVVSIKGEHHQPLALHVYVLLKSLTGDGEMYFLFWEFLNFSGKGRYCQQNTKCTRKNRIILKKESN